MATLTDSLLISVPYSREEDLATSPRYRWNSLERGSGPFVILQWTYAGRGRLDYNGKTWDVPAHHAFIVVVPEPSCYYYPADGRAPWTFGWLNFYGNRGCEVGRAFRAEFGPVIPLDEKGTARAALKRLCLLAGDAEKMDPWQASLQAHAFMLEWWRELAHPRHAGRKPGGLDRALRYCRERFREPLAVKQLAYEAGMSREHFSRTFASRLGKTPAAYLRGLRIKEAAQLLRETRLPLPEIAMRSGFGSARHLMKAFQRERGTSTSAYRRRAR